MTDQLPEGISPGTPAPDDAEANPSAQAAVPAAPAAKPEAPAEPVPGAIRFEDVVSGDYDAQDEDADAAPAKRVLAPRPTPPSCTRCWPRPAWAPAWRWSS